MNPDNFGVQNGVDTQSSAKIIQYIGNLQTLREKILINIKKTDREYMFTRINI